MKASTRELKDFVKKQYYDYLCLVELDDKKSIDKCIKRVADHEIEDENDVLSLSVNDMVFFVAFNESLSQDAEMCEAVAFRVACAQGKGVNVHTLSAFLAKSVLISELTPETVICMVKLLSTMVADSYAYNFELPFLRQIKTKIEAYAEECRSLLGFISIDDYKDAKELLQVVEKTIRVSSLKKARALGWSIVK